MTWYLSSTSLLTVSRKWFITASSCILLVCCSPGSVMPKMSSCQISLKLNDLLNKVMDNIELHFVQHVVWEFFIFPIKIHPMEVFTATKPHFKIKRGHYNSFPASSAPTRILVGFFLLSDIWIPSMSSYVHGSAYKDTTSLHIRGWLRTSRLHEYVKVL